MPPNSPKSVSVSGALFARLKAHRARTGIAMRSVVKVALEPVLGSDAAVTPADISQLSKERGLRPSVRYARRQLEQAEQAEAALAVRAAMDKHRAAHADVAGALSSTVRIPLSPERIEDIEAAAMRSGGTLEETLDVALWRMVDAMTAQPVWCRRCCEDPGECRCEAVAR